MSIDIKQIQKNYELKEDFEIERIATSNSKGLRPEVYEIIENEIKKRNLNPNLLNGVISQNRVYSLDELKLYSDYLRNLSCPKCKNKTQKLNGTISYTIKSFILITSKETKTSIACPSCLIKKNNEAILICVLLGWWSIPLGLLQTPYYIFKNFNSKKQTKSKEPNFALLNFVNNNIGYIESYKDDIDKLIKIINQ